jgi:hypothetical protein
MLGALSAALISLDQACERLALAIHGHEPQIYALIVLAALVWVFTSPKDDPDQI